MMHILQISSVVQETAADSCVILMVLL